MKKCIGILFVLATSVTAFSQIPELTVKNDKIGVNIEAPTKQFHIEGYSNTNSTVLHSKVNYVGAFDVRAIDGHSITNTGYGIGGHFIGGYSGVKAIGEGQDYSGSYPVYGVYAIATGTTGTRIGLFSEATGGSKNIAAKFGSGDVEVLNGLRVGTILQNGKLHVKSVNQVFGSTATVIQVEGSHNGSQPCYGMYATIDGSGSGDAYGVRAQGNVTGTGNSYGVRALAYATGTGGVAYGLHSQVTEAQGWALYAVGKNYMSGDLRIGTVSDPYGGAYRLIVDGNIIAEEVRVQNSATWPDYVFQEDYNLLPLKELAESIRENGHLPNIPPAAIVDREGIQIGDMQVRMMEKIEELTLYIIQQHKEIEVLKDKVELLTIEK